MNLVNQSALSDITEEIGKLIVNNRYGLSTDTGNGQDEILRAEVGNTEGSNGEIIIGNTIIQFGRVTELDTIGTSFTVTYDTPLQNAPSFVGIIPAGNNAADGDYSAVQVDGANLPTTTEATFIVTNGAGTGNDYFYWIVIGRRTDIASA